FQIEEKLPATHAQVGVRADTASPRNRVIEKLPPRLPPWGKLPRVLEYAGGNQHRAAAFRVNSWSARLALKQSAPRNDGFRTLSVRLSRRLCHVFSDFWGLLLAAGSTTQAIGAKVLRGSGTSMGRANSYLKQRFDMTL